MGVFTNYVYVYGHFDTASHPVRRTRSHRDRHPPDTQGVQNLPLQSWAEVTDARPREAPTRWPPRPAPKAPYGPRPVDARSWRGRRPSRKTLPCQNLSGRMPRHPRVGLAWASGERHPPRTSKRSLALGSPLFKKYLQRSPTGWPFTVPIRHERRPVMRMAHGWSDGEPPEPGRQSHGRQDTLPPWWCGARLPPISGLAERRVTERPREASDSLW